MPPYSTATLSTRAKERTNPVPKSLVKSGGIATTNMSAVKKESQLIARNPKRFLESFAAGRSTPVASSLSTLLANMDSDFTPPPQPQTPAYGQGQTQGQGQSVEGRASLSRKASLPAPRSDAQLLAKAAEFDSKYKLSKTRTLLLNMSMHSGVGSKSNSNLRGSNVGVSTSTLFQNMNRFSSGASTPTRKKSSASLRHFPASYHHKPGSLAESRDRYRDRLGSVSSQVMTSSRSSATSRSISPTGSGSVSEAYSGLPSSTPGKSGGSLLQSEQSKSTSTSLSTPMSTSTSTPAPESPKTPRQRPRQLGKSGPRRKASQKNRVYFSDENGADWSRRESSRYQEEEDEQQEQGFGYYDKDLDKNNVDEVEEAFTEFIDRIKNSDIDNIIIWINTLASMSDVQLPFGYPSHLAIPLDTDKIKSSELRSFAEASIDEFHLLDGEYSAKLEELGKRLQDNYESIQSSRWSPKDSALLFYIMTALEDIQSSEVAGLRGELLGKLFPSFGDDQIAIQKYRLRMKRAWEEKRGAILKDWIRDREDLTNKINEGWNTLQGNLTKKGELAKERREQQERCTFWRNQLDRLRKEKRAKIRRIQVIVEPFEKALEDRTKSKLEEEAAARKSAHLLLAEFRAQQAFSRQRERREKQSLEAQLAANAKLQAEYNKSRVAVRHIAYEQKKAAALELAQLRMEEALLREEMLERSKEKVELPDYHPSNVLADTHSSLLHRSEIPDQVYDLSPEEEEMVNFFRSRYSHGFSSERVLRDRRHRLESKLRDAGLIHNSYARQVLLSLEPKPKPHLLSQIDLREEGQGN